MLSAALYAHVRISYYHCTWDRGCSAHPAFPAPSGFRGRRVSRKPRALRAARTRTYIPVSSPATGSAEWPPDDRLRRVTQYSRDANDRTDRPRRTGYPHSRVWQHPL